MRFVVDARLPPALLVDTSIWSLALRRRPAALSGAEDQLAGEWA